MIRLALLAAASFAVTACVADQQQPQTDDTSSVDQSSTAVAALSGCDGKNYPNPCVYPTMWNPATQSTINDFWYGIAAGTPSKVMIHAYTYGRSAAAVGGGETSPSTYVFLIAGAWDGSNAYWKAVEVKGSDMANYRATLRLLYDTREIALGTVWDGGAGGDLGGSPGGHIGPHGFPQILITHLLDLSGAMRSDYGTHVQTDIQNMQEGAP